MNNIGKLLRTLFRKEFLTLQEFVDAVAALTETSCRLNKDHTRLFVGELVFEIELERHEGDRKILTGPHLYYKYWTFNSFRRLK
jgi:hypothetical protein